MTMPHVILAAVALSRGFELWLSAQHEAALRRRGGYEVGAGHYPALVALHTAWLFGLFLLAGDAPLIWPWLVVFVLLQLARVWTIRSLGVRWTTRIIVVPNEPLIQRGPYRFLRHPNYLIVAGEIAVLPLAFNLPIYALLFSIANATLLAIRIQCEDEALQRSLSQSSPPQPR